MKRRIRDAFALVTLLGFSACAGARSETEAPAGALGATARADGVVWEERFERLPADWHSMSGASDRDIRRVFGIGRETGEGFLRARHHAGGDDPPPAVHFGRSFSSAPPLLRHACVLSWRWRVLRHPEVRGDPWQDVAASVYVITDPPGLFSRGRGFKLGWLPRPGPLGTHQRGMLQVAVRVEPASEQWRAEQVDLCALFRTHFGPVGDEPLGYIGVVTDADDSASSAEADYDELVLSRPPAEIRP